MTDELNGKPCTCACHTSTNKFIKSIQKDCFRCEGTGFY